MRNETSIPNIFRPYSNLQRGHEVQFGQGATLQHSITPSLRAPGFEDEDDDEDENDFNAPGEGSEPLRLCVFAALREIFLEFRLPAWRAVG